MRKTKSEKNPSLENDFRIIQAWVKRWRKWLMVFTFALTVVNLVTDDIRLALLSIVITFIIWIVL